MFHQLPNVAASKASIGKKIIISSKTPIFEIGNNNFDTFFPPEAGLANEAAAQDNTLLLTLSQGQWCYINPGIDFEIQSYAENCDAPGYVTPFGKGRCGIYSETGETTIKLTRSGNPHCCYGTGLKGKAEYGPYYDNIKKAEGMTSIIYFQVSGAFIDSADSHSDDQEKNDMHVLMISQYTASTMILDARMNFYTAFIPGKHWRDIYDKQFEVKMTAAETSYNFTPILCESKVVVDLSGTVPGSEKVSKFICRTDLGEQKIGMRLVLSDKCRVLDIPFIRPHDDTMLFWFNNASFLIIPETPKGKLLIFPLQQYQAQGATVIGYCKNVVKQFNPNFFSRSEQGANNYSGNSFSLQRKW